MQSHLDAFRIKELGADPEKVFVTGNLKFDELSTKNGAVTFSETKLGFSKTDNIIVAGSTHYPEENMIIDIFKRLKEKEKALKLILAPRHIERTGAIRVYCDRAGIKYERLSRILQPGVLSVKNADMILVDTIGHLKDLYRLASIVFIGGSIADKGGQNPIEAAVWGKPVIYGPNMNNFRQVSGLFLDKDAACRVKDEKELEIILADLVNNPLRREEISRNAGKVISENTGAIDRTIDKIERFLRNIA
jgi:3-deoxy-D-manno-octulosonic-acid transferase